MNPFEKPTKNLPTIDGLQVLRVLQVTVSEDEGTLYKCLLEDGTQIDVTEKAFTKAQDKAAV